MTRLDLNPDPEGPVAPDGPDALDLLTGAERHVYKTTPEGELPIHRFAPAPEPTDPSASGVRAAGVRATGAPAIVLFFGGGWTGGTPVRMAPMAARFAAAGFVAFAADYRVRQRHGASPWEAMADGRDAVAWVHAHATALGVDPDRLYAGGGSAGGHVAACAALLAHGGAADMDGPTPAPPPTPKGLALFNPVLDTTAAGYGVEKVGPDPERASPVHHVVAGLPPTFIAHGTGDETVPFENAERFARQMTEAGNHCELAAYPGRAHGFFNHGSDFEDVAARAIRFLLALER